MDENNKELQEKRVRIIENELKGYQNLFVLLTEKRDKFEDSFLKIKLGFLSFTGVITTVVFLNKNEFSRGFLIVLISTITVAFSLLSVELFSESIDKERAMRDYFRKTMLAKIRHLAALRDDYHGYANRAEELLLQQDRVEQQVRGGEPISRIIEQKESIFFKLTALAWYIILVFVPLLLLFEILNKT